MTKATNTDSLRANGFGIWVDADDANWYDALNANGFLR